MADVSSNFYDWSTTAASNGPSGATTIGTGLDDNLREIQAVIRSGLATVGANIASAGTTDLGAVPGLRHLITGTTTITSFGTVSAGIWKVVVFQGALTMTHNATSLILPTAANITTAAGDVAIVQSEGSGNWRCLSYARASGRALANPTNLRELPTSLQGWLIGTLSGGTPVIANDYNVSGLVDDGVGQVTVTWDTDFVDANYAVVVTGSVETNAAPGVLLTRTAGGASFLFTDLIGAVRDVPIFTVLAAGDSL